MTIPAIETFYTDEAPNMIRDSDLFFPRQTGGQLPSEERGRLHDLRNQIRAGKKHFYCAFCNNPLQIYGDRMRRYHFEHLHQSGENPPYEECIYYSGYQLSPEEIARMKYNGAKESPLHLRLKTLVQEQLGKTGEVVLEKIIRDNKNKHRWRKPDLRWITPDKDVAIEVQVTTTSLNTIIGRSDFYSERNMFIWWIVNEPDESFTNYDIFADSEHNLFVLDHEAEEKSENDLLYLKCYHYDYYIDTRGQAVKMHRLTWDWVTPDMLTFERKEINGIPVCSVYYKNDRQLIEEAQAKDAEQTRLQEEEDRKRQEEADKLQKEYINLLQQWLQGKLPSLSSIPTKYDKSARSEAVAVFMQKTMVDKAQMANENFAFFYNKLINYLQEDQHWHIRRFFPAKEDSTMITLIPVLEQDCVPDFYLFDWITNLYQDQFTVVKEIQNIQSRIMQLMRDSKSNNTILSQYCYVNACQRIIDANEEEIYEEGVDYDDENLSISYTKEPTGEYGTSDHGKELLGSLYQNAKLFLLVQSFLVGRCLPYSQDLTGMANSIKVSNSLRPYYHLLTQAYRVYQSAHNASINLQKMMDAISQLQSQCEQKEDLDELFATIFPKVYSTTKVSG